MSYPIFLFLLNNIQYTELTKYKEKIYKLLDNIIIVNLRAEYRWIGLLCAPSINHFNPIIFNSIGLSINNNFTPNNIYYHDGMLNNGCINALKDGEDWKNIGIPYIVLCKKIEA